MLISDLSSQSLHGVTVTRNDDGSYTFDTGAGTATAATSFKFFSAKGSEMQGFNGKWLSGLSSGASGKYSMRISMRNSPWTTYVSELDHPVKISGIPNTSDVIDVDLYVYSGATMNNVIVYPMISEDLTNRELTKSADDQKTTINAIISAATGATDFAAFKTAMEALTPLTRSIPSGSDQRSLQDITPEVEPEENEAEEASEPVTKKRSTKKTVKEGE